jgi:hypothetical protein
MMISIVTSAFYTGIFKKRLKDTSKNDRVKNPIAMSEEMHK